MRKMAYTVTVSNVTPIEGKDKIQIINFKENGYSVIASKEIKVGDVVMYFEVDSILPVCDRFEFLRKRCFKQNLNGFLIKNMKMFNIYSNGLVMTQKELGIEFNKSNVDYTDELMVGKYEPEDDASPKQDKKGFMSFLWKYPLTRPIAKFIATFSKKDIKKVFPTHLIHKSDETNIQNMPQMFNVWKKIPCYITAKMEGQSVTVVYEKGFRNKVSVFGRNYAGNDRHYAYFNNTDLFDRIKRYVSSKGCKSIAIQGEFCAPGVQGGIYQNGTHFYVYRVNIDGKSVDLRELYAVCEKLNLEHVPVLMELPCGYGESFKDVPEIQEYVEHLWFTKGDVQTFLDSNGIAINKNTMHRHEGIVVRSKDSTTFSFKVKSNEYQLSR